MIQIPMQGQLLKEIMEIFFRPSDFQRVKSFSELDYYWTTLTISQSAKHPLSEETWKIESHWGALAHIRKSGHDKVDYPNKLTKQIR